MERAWQYLLKVLEKQNFRSNLIILTLDVQVFLRCRLGKSGWGVWGEALPALKRGVGRSPTFFSFPQRMSYAILMVNSAPNAVLSLKFLPKKEGFAVQSVEDGNSAIRVRAAKKPNLVILDVMVPKRNNHKVGEVAPTNLQWRGIRVIQLMAKKRETEQKKSLVLSANDCVTQSFLTREWMTRACTMLDRCLEGHS
ncbi:MAG: hypothetical protein H7835_19530 [Magnetococcus sp. XQGC-1]